MEELGYDIEWYTFNSKYHGVPQNRERVYTVGHLRRYGRCKVFPISGTAGEDSADIKIAAHHKKYRRNTITFMPNGVTGALDTASGGNREHHVALPIVIDPQGRTSKENIPSETVPTLRAQSHGNQPCVVDKVVPMFGLDKNVQGKEIQCANALTAREDRGVSNFKQTGTAVCIPVLTPDRAEKRQNGRRMKENGEDAFTLTAQDIHGVAIGTKVKIREATAKGYAEAEVGDSVNPSMPESKTRRGRVGKKQANTLDTSCEQGVIVPVPVIWYDKYKCYIAIRKLTPKECFRLQGWTDDYFEKAQFVNSDSQLYKQAGNGVTVNVVKDIARAIGECKQ